ncbi:MAG: DMT family transporter, partial [Coriobacteriaceae bacterium]|nr:DMT family transporter [Coriobacteriaceae bacterium]
MKAKGPILLLITAILWGFAFVAQTTASSDIGPFTFNASRNIIGAVFLTGVIAMRKRLGHDEAPQLGSDGNASGCTRKALVIAGVTCGVVLFAASYLQQAGITSYPAGAAASGRSGFVTATYMIMVALMGVVVGKKTQPIVFVAVAVSMLGMYLLCVPNGLGSIYVGDWLVLASAFGYALHIIVIDRFTRIDGVRLSRVQLMTSAAIAFVCALAFEHPDPAAIAAALVPILYAGICSDGIAYTFQIIAQKTTDPTVASILMSLESVFAAIGGWLILSESLSAVELLGCALVFAAVMLAQMPQF